MNFACARSCSAGTAACAPSTKACTDKDSPPRQLAELDALVATVGRITVPLLHADELYALRSQSEMVRRRLQLIVAGQPDPGLRRGGGDRAAA